MKINVEMLDEYIRLQEVTNDHQIRGVITFREHLDVEKLKRSIKKTFNYVPIVGCKYLLQDDKAIWESGSDYSDKDFFSVSSEKISEEILLMHLKNIPDQYNGPQVAFHLVQQDTNDILIVTLNHMVFDGSGFKSYLYLLAEVYSNEAQYENKGAEDINLRRHLSLLLKNIPLWQQIHSLFRKAIVHDDNKLLIEQSDITETRICLLKISSKEYQGVKSLCKIHGLTINDFILALMCQAIFSLERYQIDENLTIQTMFDLRRYVKRYPVSQFGNFSSMESLQITKRDQSFLGLANEIGEKMKKIKSRYPGVKNILLLDTLFKLLPRKRFENVLSGEIRSLGISTSNLGIIDNSKLSFDNVEVMDVYILTSIKNQPSLQLTVSTFKENMTLSVLGNYSDKNWNAVRKICENMTSLLNDFLNA